MKYITVVATIFLAILFTLAQADAADQLTCQLMRLSTATAAGCRDGGQSKQQAVKNTTATMLVITKRVIPPEGIPDVARNAVEFVFTNPNKSASELEIFVYQYCVNNM